MLAQLTAAVHTVAPTCVPSVMMRHIISLFLLIACAVSAQEVCECAAEVVCPAGADGAIPWSTYVGPTTDVSDVVIEAAHTVMIDVAEVTTRR